MRLSLRKKLAALLLGVSILIGGYVAIPREESALSPISPTSSHDNLLIRTVAALNQLEVVHLVSHLLVFGSVAFLVGPWSAQGGSVALAWRYVLVGGILMEAVQIGVGYTDDTLWSLTYSLMFDMIVNGLGGTIGLKACITTMQPN